MSVPENLVLLTWGQTSPLDVTCGHMPRRPVNSPNCGRVTCNIWNAYCLDPGRKGFLTSVLHQHEKFAWVWLCLSFSSLGSSSAVNTCEDVSSF